MSKLTPKVKVERENWLLNRVNQILAGLLILFLPIQLGKHFWPNFSYVFGLSVDYLSPTIYLTDLLVLGLLFVWLLKIRNWELGIRNWLKKYWYILVFFLYLLLSSLLAANSSAALYKFLKVLELSFFGFYVFKNYRLFNNLVLKLLPLALIYEAIIVYLQIIKQASFGLWILGERTFFAGTPGIALADFGQGLFLRPYGTFSHPNSLSGFFLISLFLVTPYWYRKNKKFCPFFLLFTIPVLLFAFSRAVWVVSLLSVMGMSYWFWGKGKRIITLIVFVFVAFIGFTLLFLPILGAQPSHERIGLLRTSVEMINLSPITGVGLNNFISLLPVFWQTGQTYLLQPVHNIYLLVAAENGLIGLLFFLWFLYLTFKKLILNRPANFFLYPFLSILLLGLFDHYWLTLQQNMLLFSIVLGLIWGASNKDNVVK
ncbi:MAG: O-antigen ligase family protein [bacterium]|nr:O-antigen ligase family protein [bacterium]